MQALRLTRRFKYRTPRHAVTYVALYKVSTAFDSARPALRAPHAAADVALCDAGTALDSARLALQTLHAAANNAICGASTALQAPHDAANVALCNASTARDVAVSASCDAGAAPAPGAARTIHRGTPYAAFCEGAHQTPSRLSPPAKRSHAATYTNHRRLKQSALGSSLRLQPTC
jgi:hypothetical protein